MACPGEAWLGPSRIGTAAQGGRLFGAALFVCQLGKRLLISARARPNAIVCALEPVSVATDWARSLQMLSQYAIGIKLIAEGPIDPAPTPPPLDGRPLRAMRSAVGLYPRPEAEKV